MIYNKIQSFFTQIPGQILEHRVITSLIFSIGVTYFYAIGLIKNIKTTLPQIISFASIMLAVLSLVFSIIISIKDGKMYQILKEYLGDAIQELHKILKECIVFSILVVLYSLTLLSIEISPTFLKWMAAGIGLFLFGMMVCLCLSSFLISITLLKNSDKYK
jgi:predicted ABC-type exoprotein transport system permease subunit